VRRLTFIAVLTLAGPATFAQHDHSAAPLAVTKPETRPTAREWTKQPLLVPVMGQRGERSGAALRPTGIEATELRVFAADGPGDRRQVAYPVGPDGAKFKPAEPNTGNYHWVIARQESDAEVRVASTAWYFSNPGEAPTELLKQSRHELEIVPEPLPREHGHYRESEKWRFLVRWQGRPLANQPLAMETEFGSRSSILTDAEGYATIVFPRDFRPPREGERAGHGGPRRAKFVLATERTDAGKRYLTAFNYSYSPDPDRDRSLGWGAAFGLIGMVAALPLLRRRAATTDSAEANHA
jgi:hypothetical protein